MVGDLAIYTCTLIDLSIQISKQKKIVRIFPILAKG